MMPMPRRGSCPFQPRLDSVSRSRDDCGLAFKRLQPHSAPTWYECRARRFFAMLHDGSSCALPEAGLGGEVGGPGRVCCTCFRRRAGSIYLRSQHMMQLEGGALGGPQQGVVGSLAGAGEHGGRHKGSAMQAAGGRSALVRHGQRQTRDGAATAQGCAAAAYPVLSASAELLGELHWAHGRWP